MLERFLPQSYLTTSFAIAVVAAFFLAASSTLSAARPPLRQVPLRVFLTDTGKTVALSVGQELIVAVPLTHQPDNLWSVSQDSGARLKLIAGPDEVRGRYLAPEKRSQQLFYFIRESAGTTHLVLEQKYFSKPMILTVVDR